MTNTQNSFDPAQSHEAPLTAEENKLRLAARAEELARNLEEAVDVENQVEVTTFQIGQSVYAFESRMIGEISTVKAITPLPGTPSFIDGLIYLRGQIITLVSLHKLLDLQSNAPMKGSHAILAKSSELFLAFRVDQVLDVINVSRSSIDLSRQGLNSVYIDYVMGVVDNFTIVLDLAKLMADPRLIIDDK